MLNTLDTYRCEVDGRPALIAVDLGFASSMPVTGVPYMAYLCIYLLHTDEHGLCTESEASNLECMEQALVDILQGMQGYYYVGNCITDGQCDFVFYVSDVKKCSQQLERVMASFSAYRFEIQFHEEARWNTYFTFLCPDAQEMEDVRVNRLYRKLVAIGFDVNKPCLIRHSISFASRSDRDIYGEAAVQDEYAVYPIPQRSLGGKHVLHLERKEQVGTLSETVLELIALAKLTGGNYNGWQEIGLHNEFANLPDGMEER